MIDPMHDITDEEIRAHYEVYAGGPNPYYRCLHCAAVEPGLRRYLTDHMRACTESPQEGLGS